MSMVLGTNGIVRTNGTIKINRTIKKQMGQMILGFIVIIQQHFYFYQ
jgi:hypothetical protein